MSLSDDVDLEEFVLAKDELSGADIKAVCTEAGLLALRERRMRVQMSDLRGAREKVLFRKKDEGPAGLCECLPLGSIHALGRLLTTTTLLFCFIPCRPVGALLYILLASQPLLQLSSRVATIECESEARELRANLGGARAVLGEGRRRGAVEKVCLPHSRRGYHARLGSSEASQTKYRKPCQGFAGSRGGLAVGGVENLLGDCSRGGACVARGWRLWNLLDWAGQIGDRARLKRSAPRPGWGWLLTYTSHQNLYVPSSQLSCELQHALPQLFGSLC